MDEFASAIANTTATSNMTASSGGMQMISGKSIKLAGHRSGSNQTKDSNIMDVLKMADFPKKSRLGPLPALDHTNTLAAKGVLNKSAIKQFDSNRPVKVMQA